MFKKINDYINVHYIKTFILTLAIATIVRVIVEFFINKHFLNVEFGTAAIAIVVISLLIRQDFKK